MVGIWLKQLSRPHPTTLAFALLLLAFVLTFGWMAWAGNRTFMPILFDTDVAMFHSVMKHALRGELPPFYHQYAGTWTHYFAADHFNPEIFLVLPLWALLPGNVAFAWVQIAAYAAGTAFIFAIARLRLDGHILALVLATAFLLSPQPGWSLYNHATSAPFVVLFLPWTVWALLRGSQRWYWVALAGLLLAREDAAILGIAVGVYAWFLRGRRRQGALTVGLSAAYLVVVIWVVLPPLSGGAPYPYIARGYAWLGQTPTEALWRLVSDLGGVIHRIDTMGGIRGLTLHLLPFALTPLASWRGLILFLPVTYLVLHPHASSLAYHYAYWAAALAGLAAVEGVRQLQKSLLIRLPGRRGEAVLGGMLLLVAVAAHVWAGYSPLSRSFSWAEFIPGPRERAMRTALDLLPRNVTVAASRIYLTHVVPTRDLQCVWEHVEVREDAPPPGLWCVDWNRPLASDYVLIVGPRDTATMRQLLASDQYGVLFFRQDVALLQRGASTSPNRTLARGVFRVRQARDLPREIGTVVFDPLAEDGYAVKTPEGKTGLALYGWYRWVCPGLHQVALRVRGGGGMGEVGRLEVVSEAGTTVAAALPLQAWDLRGKGYEDRRLSFVITDRRQIEVRVRATGRTTLWLDRVSLDPLDTRPRPLVPPEDEPC